LASGKIWHPHRPATCAPGPLGVTAQGDLAAQVALANPHLTGQGFDLPEVAPIFEEYVATVGVADRVSFAAGSFFDRPLPKADVVMMGHILHDWDLPTKPSVSQPRLVACTEDG
jgi:hypothetical protein